VSGGPMRRALFLGGPLHGQVRAVTDKDLYLEAECPYASQQWPPTRVRYEQRAFADLDRRQFLVYQCQDDPRPLRSLLLGGLSDEDTTTGRGAL
jgi:hypothetical protein